MFRGKTYELVNILRVKSPGGVGVLELVVMNSYNYLVFSRLHFYTIYLLNKLDQTQMMFIKKYVPHTKRLCKYG